LPLPPPLHSRCCHLPRLPAPLQCYCYVCDCLASECSEWGDGLAPTDHCNAHPGNAFFLSLKRQRKMSADRIAAAAALSAGMRGDGPDLPGMGLGGILGRTVSSMMGALGGLPRPGVKAELGAGAAVPPALPCRMKPIPDPSGDRDLMLLARVEVPVKAQGNHTIAGLRDRLEPTGFYLSPDHANHYGDK